MPNGAFGNRLFECAHSWARPTLLLCLLLPVHKNPDASPHPVGIAKGAHFDARPTFVEDSLRSFQEFEKFVSNRKMYFGNATLDLDSASCLIANRNDGSCVATAREFNLAMAPFLSDGLEENPLERKKSVFIARRRAYEEICRAAFENHVVADMDGDVNVSAKPPRNAKGSVPAAHQKAYDAFLPDILKLFGRPKFHIFASTDSALIENIRISGSSTWWPEQVDAAHFPEPLIEESRALSEQSWSPHRKVPFGFLIFRRTGEFPPAAELEYLLKLLSEGLSGTAGKDWEAEVKASFTDSSHCEEVTVDSLLIGLTPRRLGQENFRENAIPFKRIAADSLPDAVKGSLPKTRTKGKFHLLAGRFGEWWIERIPTKAEQRCLSGRELQRREVARLKKAALDSIFRASSSSYLSKKTSRLSSKALASKRGAFEAEVTAAEADSLGRRYPGVDRVGVIRMVADSKMESARRHWIEDNLRVLFERDSKGPTTGIESGQ